MQKRELMKTNRVLAYGNAHYISDNELCLIAGGASTGTQINGQILTVTPDGFQDLLIDVIFD